MAASKKTRGLGKGLDALFGDAEVTLQSRAEKNSKNEDEKTEDPKQKVDKNERTGGGIDYIDINDIKPNSNQPRKTFDEDKLNELAASIEEHGLIQPLVLRKAEKGYEIVAGERRWRAARKIGIREIPCIVRELTDEENMLLAIIENMQREDLNPIEEAEGIRQMIETYGLTQEEVSKSVGKSRPYIANSLRLLRLPETVRKYVEDGSLSTGHAKAIAAVSDEKKQIELAEVAIRDGLSVRQLEKLAQQDKSGVKTRSRVKQKTADVKRVEEDLKNALGTKVTLNQKGKKGKIEIEFYSKDELERLIELLKKLG
ncbi:MAG: ParB/RepB/Spo0J family partition protein [Lentihominibacter sp.]|nr:ParB/RepB/Spo0J family partition protein [Lentihominibacter sp.]